MTAPANPASADDIAARWRPLTGSEEDVAETHLGDAWVMLRRKPGLGDVATRYSSDDDLKAETVRVLCAAVTRLMQNPEGHKQESRAIDDASRGWTIGDSRADGHLYFTDDELDSLRATTVRRNVAFSITPWSPPCPSSSSSSSS